MNSNNIDIEKVKNNLRILRIEENDVSKITFKKIRTAYLKNSIKYHPDKNGGKDEEFKKQVLSMIPLGRLGEISDLMGPFVFLASEASSLMTGSSVLVDGGWTSR